MISDIKDSDSWLSSWFYPNDEGGEWSLGSSHLDCVHIEHSVPLYPFKTDVLVASGKISCL